MELAEFRKGLDDWLSDNHDQLAPPFVGPGTLDQQMAQLNLVKRLTWEAGWGRWGWPERIGGLGGSTLLRAYLGEALTARDLVEAGLFSMNETLVDKIPGMRGIYAGRLRNARQVETLTCNLVSINRRYKAHSGLRITDV